MRDKRTAGPGTPSANPDALLLTGLQKHQNGQFAEASKLYAQALALSPDHADALNLAGACAFSQGQSATAIKLISKAVRIAPHHLDAYLNLAEALDHAGRQDEAISTCRKLLERKPDSVEGHGRLARLLAERGEFELSQGHCAVALALDPQDVRALCVHAELLRWKQKFLQADAAFAQALTLAPDDVDAHFGRASLLSQVDRTSEALEHFHRALAIRPDDAKILAGCASALETRGDHAKALELINKALALAPGAQDMVQQRARLLRDSGDFESAGAEFKKILAANPKYAPAILSLARLKQLDVESPIAKGLPRLVSDASQPIPNRSQAAFALAELFDRAGDCDQAFKYYSEANRLQAARHARIGQAFDPKDLLAKTDLMVNQVAGEYAHDTSAWAVQSELPVFVVGMPRSGTTLVEQICASHSRVLGAGERGAVMNLARAIAERNEGRERLGDWDAEFARAQAKTHLKDLSEMAKGASRVIDKSPLNVMRLGLIGALFPQARIIWCRRDARDTVFSNHTLYFGDSHFHSTNQAHCAFAFRQIERLGECWKQLGTLQILEVVYEDLVANPGEQVPRLIDFLGLGWEAACMDFHKTKRRVDTPSTWQVRQPVYSSSIGRWKRYEKHLGPMLAELARAPSSPLDPLI